MFMICGLKTNNNVVRVLNLLNQEICFVYFRILFHIVYLCCHNIIHTITSYEYREEKGICAYKVQLPCEEI